MDIKRWSVRNIEEETLAILRQMSDHWGVRMGDLVNEAVVVWYNRLPIEDDNSDGDEDNS